MRYIVLLLLFGLIPAPALAQVTEPGETAPDAATAPSTSSVSSNPEVPTNNGRSVSVPPRSPHTRAITRPGAASAETVDGRPIGVRPTSRHVAAAPRTDLAPLNNGRLETRMASRESSARPASKALSPSTVRITNAGPDGDARYDAFHPDLAYNPTVGEYFAVWAGNDDSGSLAANETEIFGVRVSETTGQPLSAPVRISTMGGDGDPSFAALHPTVAYNPVQDDYFVVWQGSATANEFEIFGRRLNASDLALGSQIQLTNTGTAGDASVDAQAPAVAVNPVDGTYFLAWHANPDGDMEVFGQGLTPSGDIGGSSLLQLSEAGPFGDTQWRAAHADVAFDPVSGGFWIVWSGSDDQGGIVPGEREIFLRRVDDSGTLIGTDGQRISAAGTDGDASVGAERPRLLADVQVGEMFVTWSSNAVDGAGAYEIYGQRLDLATATEQGTDDLRLSTMGPNGQPQFSGFASSVAGISNREYTIVWRGDDPANDAFDVYVQRVYADRSLGDQDGDDDLQLSVLSDGGSAYGAVTAEIAAGPSDTYLVIWSGDTSGSGTLVEGEHEIFGQILSLGEPLPVELSTFGAQPNADGIRLVWQTLSETNNDRFEVQRRVDESGLSARVWHTVGTVRGQGTTTESVDYQFTDARVPYAADALVYRLRQVDVDGVETFSDEVRVTRSGVDALELLGTFPNPAHSVATVQFAVPTGTDAEDVRLMLFDMLGRRVRSVQEGIRAGRNEIRLDVSGLAPGVYFLRLAAGSQIRTQKLTVVR